MFTLKPLNAALPKRHGQIEWDVMFMITHHPQKLKLKLIQRLSEEETERRASDCIMGNYRRWNVYLKNEKS